MSETADKGEGHEPMVIKVTPSRSVRIDLWMRASVAKSTEAVAWRRDRDGIVSALSV